MNKQTSIKVVIGTVVFLSVSANMAMAGMMAGGLDTPAVAKITKAFAAFADLSDASRDKTVDIFKKEWPKIQDQIKDIRDKRQQARAILAKEDYKRADLEKVLNDLRADMSKLQEEGQTVALDAVDAITPQERMKLMETISLNK